MRISKIHFFIIYYYSLQLRWSRCSVLALVPKFASSKPFEAEGRKKILSTPSFGGEVKPSVPCPRFAACKRSLNLRGSRNSGKITTGHLSRPQFHLSLLGSLASLRTEARGNVSRRGKAMANYPQELSQDAVCQSHTGHKTGLWFLPSPAFKAEY